MAICLVQDRFEPGMAAHLADRLLSILELVSKEGHPHDWDAMVRSLRHSNKSLLEASYSYPACILVRPDLVLCCILWWARKFD